jgi:predicted acylesterase/phospholipase RssA
MPSRPQPFARALLCCALALGCGLNLTAACSHPSRMAAVPTSATTRAVVPGMPPTIRFWALDDPTAYIREVVASSEREKAHLAQTGRPGPLPHAYYLAISGGGDDGAFGAGVIVGWTQAGTRPEFKLVTGISTGALTAPFAFLGPAYDAKLEEVYTTVSTKDIVTPRHPWAALLSDGMVDPTPLSRLVARFIDAETLDRIAEEFRKGRVLVVVTANLDAPQPVIWNMGAIAASGHPKALDLFHTILIAAVSSPGVFPPVMIDVDVDGQRYQEMHVDGGAMAEVFLYPAMVHVQRVALSNMVNRERTLYIIRNAHLDSPWASVQRQTLSIARRALNSLVQTQGFGDLYRIYALALRDGVDFNLAYIPAGFSAPRREEFDPAYMTKLFARGRALAASGYVWDKAPPGYID